MSGRTRLSRTVIHLIRIRATKRFRKLIRTSRETVWIRSKLFTLRRTLGKIEMFKILSKYYSRTRAISKYLRISFHRHIC